MIVSKLTSKAQTTIPQPVRAALGLEPVSPARVPPSRPVHPGTHEAARSCLLRGALVGGGVSRCGASAPAGIPRQEPPPDPVRNGPLSRSSRAPASRPCLFSASTRRAGRYGCRRPRQRRSTSSAINVRLAGSIRWQWCSESSPNDSPPPLWPPLPRPGPLIVIPKGGFLEFLGSFRFDTKSGIHASQMPLDGHGAFGEKLRVELAHLRWRAWPSVECRASRARRHRPARAPARRRTRTTPPPPRTAGTGPPDTRRGHARPERPDSGAVRRLV